MHRAASSATRVAVIKGAPGSVTFLALEALAGRRRTVVLEFLPRPVPRRWTHAALFRAWRRAVERPAVRRAMLVGQVLTEWERDRYAGAYLIPPERLVHVPWAFRRDDRGLPPFDPEARTVLSSGRAGCDWETLFAAARGASWPLTVICARPDLRDIERLNQDSRAEVLCEIPRETHDERLRSAGAYAVTLSPTEGPSVGHVRVMAAVGAGVPIVATDVAALDGYVVDGATAVLVPPGDPDALRTALDRLLADPAQRRRLRERASAHADQRSYSDYFRAIRELLVAGL